MVGGRNRIVLNGKPTFLLATLDQGYWPDGIYTAPTDAALKFDIQKTRDLGFNTIRKHIKVEPARWYYWTDRIGLMVWQDMPALPDGHNDKLSDADKAGFRADVSAIVDALRGETSIIGWIPFNEGWGQWSIPAAAELAAQIKQLDPSRLVDARSGANCCDTKGDPHAGDVYDVHDYQGPGLPEPDAKRAAIDGEHGGLTLGIPGHVWPNTPINPYGAVKDRDALNAGYVANTAVLRATKAWPRACPEASTPRSPMSKASTTACTPTTARSKRWTKPRYARSTRRRYVQAGSPNNMDTRGSGSLRYARVRYDRVRFI